MLSVTLFTVQISELATLIHVCTVISVTTYILWPTLFNDGRIYFDIRK